MDRILQEVQGLGGMHQSLHDQQASSTSDLDGRLHAVTQRLGEMGELFVSSFRSLDELMDRKIDLMRYDFLEQQQAQATEGADAGEAMEKPPGFGTGPDAAGVQRDTLKSLDPSRSQARIAFTNVPTIALGGDSPAGEQALADLLDRAAVLLAFEQIGGGQATMDMGISYTKERYAFGRPVASFQAIKHKFADMFTALELARANAYYAASALANDAPDLPLAAATARVSATDAYYLISKENIQAHGGMGFTWEFDCHLYYRRAQLLSSVIGTQPQWKEKIVDRLLAAA